MKKYTLKEWLKNYAPVYDLSPKAKSDLKKVFAEESINSKIKERENLRIGQAEQQFLGFALGSQGHSIKELASSMGLEKEEWECLRKEELVNCLLDSQIQEVDEMMEVQF